MPIAPKEPHLPNSQISEYHSQFPKDEYCSPQPIFLRGWKVIEANERNGLTLIEASISPLVFVFPPRNINMNLQGTICMKQVPRAGAKIRPPCQNDVSYTCLPDACVMSYSSQVDYLFISPTNIVALVDRANNLLS